MFWKQYGGWAIDLKDRYTYDPFFRSECNVIILQVIFAFFLLVSAFIFFNYLLADLSIYVYVLVGTLLTLLFSYIIARVTLAPVRSAIDSQKRFISDIAHELRTPISIIRTNSEVAMIDETKGSRFYNVMKSNIEELDRVSQIINNILSFSRLVRSDRVEFGDVDFALVVEQAIRELKELLEKKEIELIMKKTGSHIVWGNQTALQQIVSNILRNAINYTPENGRILLTLKLDMVGNTVLSVTDNGVGISRADLPHIFEPFYRADKSRSRKVGSTGLGLTIVSELLKLHAGKITVRSSLNQGTVVIITLPYTKESYVPNRRERLMDEVSVDFSTQVNKKGGVAPRRRQEDLN